MFLYNKTTMEKLTRRLVGEFDVYNWRLHKRVENECFYKIRTGERRRIRVKIEKDRVELCPVGRTALMHFWSLTFHKNGDIDVYEHGVIKGKTTWESFQENFAKFSQVERSKSDICDLECIGQCFFSLVNVLIFGF